MRSQSLTLRSLLAMASMGLAGSASGVATNPTSTRQIPKDEVSILRRPFAQHTNHERSARRQAIKAAGGIRQFKRKRQAEARDRRFAEMDF